MPYIGNTIRAADDYRLIDDISSSFNGSTTSFALQVAGSAPVPFPKSPQQVLISVNGVIQEPDPSGSSGFNLVGTNIVFSSAPTNGHAFFGIIYATADYLNAGGNFPAGSLGAPSITFIGDENTGLYRKGGGSIGFVADATEIANTDSNGLTLSTGNLILGDSGSANDDRIVLGVGSDLKIYHDGNNSYIDSEVGSLIVRDTGEVEKFRVYGSGTQFNDNIILANDNDKIQIGASQDLEIYHSGSHSFIKDSGTGQLVLNSNAFRVNNAADSENMITADENGAVSLYHNDSKKLETVAGGATITGVCTATSFAGDGSSLSGITTDLVNDTSPQLGGNLASNGNNIDVADSTNSGNNRIKFGTSADLSIYHNGNHSFIEESGTGALKVLSSNIQLLNAAGNETMIQGTQNDAVELYYDNSKKFETYSDGLKFYGNNIGQTAGSYLQVTGANSNAFAIGMTSGADSPAGSDNHLQFHHWNNSSWDKVFFVHRDYINIPDTKKIGFGDSNDIEIYHESGQSYIQNSTGNFRIDADALRLRSKTGSEAFLTANVNGAVELYYDNTKRFETTANGAEVFGNNSTIFKASCATNSTAEVIFQNTEANSSGDLKLSIKTAANQGSDPYIKFDAGGNDMVVGTLYAGGASNKLVLGHGNSPSGGVIGLHIDGNGQIYPDSNNARDLGSSSLRFRNIYTNDLNLSNEGSSNDVDGTWGSYTIQEGEEDLFLVNKRNGKKYKFALTEVS